MTREEAIGIIEGGERRIAELKELDPFWYFTPTNGDISQERMDFLKEFIPPEFIPDIFYGQKEVLKSKADIIFAGGGNQGGKTTLAIIRAYIQATGELPFGLIGVFPESEMPEKFPQRIRIVCEDLVNGFEKNIKPTLRYWAPRKYLKSKSFEDVWSEKERKLTLSNGSTIEIMSDDQEVDKFQGPPINLTIFDEEPQFKNYEECLMRHSVTGLKMLFTMTPTKGMSWVYDLINSNGVDSFFMPSVVNHKIELNKLREILNKIKDPDVIRMRLLGSFVALSGLIYPHFDKRIHTIDPPRITEHNIVYLGVDPHFTTETACVWVAFDRDNTPIAVEEMFKRGTVDDICEEILFRSNKYRMGWASFDYSANTDVEIYGTNIFQDFQKHLNTKGIWCRLAPKGAGSVNYGVSEIGEMLRLDEITKKPKFFISKNCPMTINDFQTLDRDTYANEDIKGPKDKIREGKRHRHACVRYIFQLAPMWIPPQEVVPIYRPDNEMVGY